MMENIELKVDEPKATNFSKWLKHNFVHEETRNIHVMEKTLCEICWSGYYRSSNTNRHCSNEHCSKNTNEIMKKGLEERFRVLLDLVPPAVPREHEPSIQEDGDHFDASVEIRRQHASLVTEHEIENVLMASFKKLSAEEQNKTDPEAGAQSLALQGLPKTHSNEPEAIQEGNQLPLSNTRQRSSLQSASTSESEEDSSCLESHVEVFSDQELMFFFDNSPSKRKKATSTVLPVEETIFLEEEKPSTMKCVFCASDIYSDSCRNQNCISRNDKSRIETRKKEDICQPAQKSGPGEESKRPSITVQCVFCASEDSVKGSCNNQNCLSNSNKRNVLGQTEKVGHQSGKGQLHSNQNSPDQSSGESEEESLPRELSAKDVENKLETDQTEKQLSEVEAQLGALSLVTENPAQENDDLCVTYEKKMSLTHVTLPKSEGSTRIPSQDQSARCQGFDQQILTMGRCELCKSDAIYTQSGLICSNQTCPGSLFTVTTVRMDEAFTVPIVVCRNPAAESQAQSTSQIEGLHTITENSLEQNQAEPEEFQEIRHQAQGQLHRSSAGASGTSQSEAVLEQGRHSSQKRNNIYSKIICNNTRCPIHTEGWKKREDIPQCKVDEPQKHIKESGQGVQEADQNIAPNETPLSLKAVGDKLENVFETLNLSGNEQQFEVNVPQQPTQGRGQGVQEEDQKNVSDEINSSLDTAGDGLESNLMEQGEDELNDIVQELMEEYELNDLMEMFPPAVSPEVPERESNIQEEDQFDAPAEIRPQLLGLEGVLTTEVLKRLPESEQESDADKQNEMDTETGTQSLDLLGFSETQYSNEVVPQLITEALNLCAETFFAQEEKYLYKMNTPCENCKTGYLITKDSKIICNNKNCPLHTIRLRMSEEKQQCKVDVPQKPIQERGQGVQEDDQNNASDETPLSLEAVGDKLEKSLRPLIERDQNIQHEEVQIDASVEMRDKHYFHELGDGMEDLLTEQFKTLSVSERETDTGPNSMGPKMELDEEPILPTVTQEREKNTHEGDMQDIHSNLETGDLMDRLLTAQSKSLSSASDAGKHSMDDPETKNMMKELYEICTNGFVSSNKNRDCSNEFSSSHSYDRMNQIVKEYFGELPDLVPPAVAEEHGPIVQEEGQFDVSAEMRRQLPSLEGVSSAEEIMRLPASERGSNADKQNEIDREAGAQSLALQGLLETRSNGPDVIQVANQLLHLNPKRKRIKRTPLSARTFELKEDSPCVKSHEPFLKDFYEKEISLVMNNSRFVELIPPTRSNPNTPREADEVAAPVIQEGNRAKEGHIAHYSPEKISITVFSQRKNSTMRQCEICGSSFMSTRSILCSNTNCPRSVFKLPANPIEEREKPVLESQESGGEARHAVEGHFPSSSVAAQNAVPSGSELAGFCVMCERRFPNIEAHRETDELHKNRSVIFSISTAELPDKLQTEQKKGIENFNNSFQSTKNSTMRRCEICGSSFMSPRNNLCSNTNCPNSVYKEPAMFQLDEELANPIEEIGYLVHESEESDDEEMCEIRSEQQRNIKLKEEGEALNAVKTQFPSSSDAHPGIFQRSEPIEIPKPVAAHEAIPSSSKVPKSGFCVICARFCLKIVKD
ncbi:Hypothetical predicted protein [Cloeon dipterum]|uniref:Uncharacterized protein n=1 Tax=Cloeon dipterum TaxID=197152 RepID=A0A8S1C0C6_9INSE|nr:Hypothetical predicted protein [Cloeon dipterum]